MHQKHWSVDEDLFRARDPEGYWRWRMEQRINFGLTLEKLDREELKRSWDKLSIDPDRKRYLQWLLWPKRS